MNLEDEVECRDRLKAETSASYAFLEKTLTTMQQ